MKLAGARKFCNGEILQLKRGQYEDTHEWLKISEGGGIQPCFASSPLAVFLQMLAMN